MDTETNLRVFSFPLSVPDKHWQNGVVIRNNPLIKPVGPRISVEQEKTHLFLLNISQPKAIDKVRIIYFLASNES